MNHTKTIPDLEKVKETVANSRHRRQKLALAILQLEEVMDQLEQKNRSRRIQQLHKVLEAVCKVL
jgi:CRISPR/Cas system CSM-associated protein Csm2 small subunit